MKPAYVDRLIGKTAVLIVVAVAIACLAFGLLLRIPLSVLLGVQIIFAAAAAVVAVLTVEVRKDRVCWYFTFGIFRHCVLLSEIRELRSVTMTPFGWGYRVDGNGKAWVASGKQFLLLTTLNGERLFVNVRDPERVRSEIERGRAW